MDEKLGSSNRERAQDLSRLISADALAQESAKSPLDKSS